jgi:hypothetical protein
VAAELPEVLPVPGDDLEFQEDWRHAPNLQQELAPETVQRWALDAVCVGNSGNNNQDNLPLLAFAPGTTPMFDEASCSSMPKAMDADTDAVLSLDAVFAQVDTQTPSDVYSVFKVVPGVTGPGTGTLAAAAAELDPDTMVVLGTAADLATPGVLLCTRFSGATVVFVPQTPWTWPNGVVVFLNHATHGVRISWVRTKATADAQPAARADTRTGTVSDFCFSGQSVCVGNRPLFSVCAN